MSIYAVDFDNTLSVGNYKFPEIGEPNLALMAFLKKKRQEGHKVVLWTCREGHDLDVAVGWLRNMGLEFDAVNDNLDFMKETWANNPRKVYADFYIDDHAVSDFEELLPKNNVPYMEAEKKPARIIRR